MGLQAQPVIQLASFSETFVFDSLDPLVPETGSATLISLDVQTTPSFPSDGEVEVPDFVTVTDATTATQIRATISGSYGLGIALEDYYKTISIQNDVGTVKEYFNFNSLNSDSYSHLTDFLPQNWSYKTYTYTFLVVKTPGYTMTRTVTMEVYPNMDRHYTQIKSVVSREIVGEELDV